MKKRALFIWHSYCCSFMAATMSCHCRFTGIGIAVSSAFRKRTSILRRTQPTYRLSISRIRHEYIHVVFLVRQNWARIGRRQYVLLVRKPFWLKYLWNRMLSCWSPSVILRTVNLRFQRVVSVMSDLLWHNGQMEMSICLSWHLSLLLAIPTVRRIWNLSVIWAVRAIL